MEIGLEKENLIFTKNFEPRNYKLEELNKNMTLDFSNNQIEIISDVFKSEFDVTKQMYDLLNEDSIVNYNIWPLSVPGLKYDVKYDAFSGQKYEYRKYLAKKYGTDIMNLSGIHYNLSLDKKPQNPKEYYFDYMKKIYEFAPLMLQFVSFSPVYEKDMFDFNLEPIGKNVGLANSISLRNSRKYGYMNYDFLNLEYSDLESYEKSLENALNLEIDTVAEIYTPIRLKELDKNRVYLELRFIDLNPYVRLGITQDMLMLFRVILEYIQNLKINTDVYNALENFETVAIKGRDKSIQMQINGIVKSLKEHTNDLFDNLLKMDLNSKEQYVISKFKTDYENNMLDSNKFIQKITKSNMKISEYGKLNSFRKEQFQPLYEDKSMELSTKILMNEASNQNIDVNVLDEEFNLIELTKNGISKRIVQATKTSKDNYSSVSILENKHLTKKILENENIEVPKAIMLKRKTNDDNLWEKNLNLDFFERKKMVIKPLDTNFGLGINVLQANSPKEEIIKAIKYAFSYSNHVICEEFFEGTEYRFLVIDSDVVSVVKRTPANVVGDGIHTILELVEIKNQNPLRNKGYITPLEKLGIGEVEEYFLKIQNLTKDSIVTKGQIVYLRENSNVSTGGDSEENLDLHSEYFKHIAKKAAKALDSNICGIDMIINKDYNDYKIIEANFNPAIQMHTYPYKGIGKNVASKILDLIFD